ncbi:MAG: DegT/DnrJ/EryC1/StrS family aminotransferase [Planctomycetes bacterium]|nr:DegT/DnrJ/EryC1/StrS family aminotransferase [Planctomycetota bacterium]MBM4080066.1 DegT/DnrJ/EryC1/StrS family aminotransferase [Planctomycetota bacterium]
MARKIEKLAIDGGPKAKQHPFGSGPKHVPSEKDAVCRVLDRGSIPFARGPEVMELRAAFSKLYRAKHCITTNSGTSAIHAATGALGIGRGDEVITSPVTDAGTIIAIMAQNAVPVFADVDPVSLNMTPEGIAQRITPRTKAILVVHLAGNPCDMGRIMALARKHKLFVVEDLAQSYLCEYKGKLCGTFGHLGCFSLNDSKHIGAGDGGMVITNDAALADRADLFADKCYDRTGQGRKPFFLGYNYRMNLLAAAVGFDQLKRVKHICDRRHRLGVKLSKGIADLPGIIPHKVLPGCKCTYWYYLFHVDTSKLTVNMDTYVKALSAEGIGVSRSLAVNIMDWPLFKDKVFNPHACAWACPLYKGQVDYDIRHFPGLQKGVQGTLRTSLNEHFTDQDISEMVRGIRKVTLHYAKA